MKAISGYDSYIILSMRKCIVYLAMSSLTCHAMRVPPLIRLLGTPPPISKKHEQIIEQPRAVENDARIKELQEKREILLCKKKRAEQHLNFALGSSAISLSSWVVLFLISPIALRYNQHDLMLVYGQNILNFSSVSFIYGLVQLFRHEIHATTMTQLERDIFDEYQRRFMP